MANRQIFQHEEDVLLNDECKMLEDDPHNKTKMFKLATLKNFIGEFIKEKIPSWEYGTLKTKGKNLIESANEIYDTTQKRMVSMEEIDLVTEEGFFVDALAVKELNRKLLPPDLIVIEEKTLTGSGVSYTQISEKSGYVLANTYCYADNYLPVEVRSIRQNSQTKGYTIIFNSNIASGASYAMRFVWIKKL